MASKINSNLQPSHPKVGEAYYDDDHHYDDNDYSDERTAPKARSTLTCGCFLLELWKWWRDIVNIITDFAIGTVTLWITWNFVRTGNLDFLADNLHIFADLIQEFSSGECPQLRPHLPRHRSNTKLKIYSTELLNPSNLNPSTMSPPPAAPPESPASPPPPPLPWTQSTFNFLTPHLPPSPPLSPTPTPKPHLTLTYTTSLSGTPPSPPATNPLTHYLRRHHAALLISAPTALAHDPDLTCRLSGAYDGDDPLAWQPRPVILDPRGRWVVEGSKVMRMAREGRGRGPWVVTGMGGVREERAEALEAVGGAMIPMVVREGGGFGWGDLMEVLAGRGVGSVLVEGGEGVVGGLLKEKGLVDAVVVTVVPRWVGSGGVGVVPERGEGEGEEVRGARWVQMGEDVVVCGTLG
ncbi:hypothetical protein VE03_07117 [Pseudogymnoascus sp. 23342-1-I1]|nr:hypothetical protein VE03_07117 [Pseudogymnoascus sp. 23342-1-I1]